MSPEARSRLARIVTTTLIYTRPTSACVRLKVGAVCHDLALPCVSGRFAEGMAGDVYTALEAWFHEVFEGLAATHLEMWAQEIADLIRVRHEAQLVKPPDPRRLPLSLHR